jgi:hypothetical protein
MPFTIDPKLIENDEVRLTENNSGNLEIVHVPSGKSLEIDSTEKTSTIAGNADEVDGFDIQKNGSDTNGVINFKT